MNFTVRYAKENDYEKIEAILKNVHAMHVAWRCDVYKMADPILEKDRFMEYIKDDNCIVAESDGNVVGMIYFFVKHVNNPVQVERKILYIDTMAVAEVYRGKGIGTSMFDFLRYVAKDRGCSSFELSVNAKNEDAQKMYAKYGFRPKSYTLDMPLEG